MIEINRPVVPPRPIEQERRGWADPPRVRRRPVAVDVDIEVTPTTPMPSAAVEPEYTLNVCEGDYVRLYGKAVLYREFFGEPGARR